MFVHMHAHTNIKTREKWIKEKGVTCTGNTGQEGSCAEGWFRTAANESLQVDVAVM